MVSLKSSGNFGMGAMKKASRFRDTPPIATLTEFPNHLHLHLLPFFKIKKSLRIASQEKSTKNLKLPTLEFKF
jgi:hypothetical protein